MPFPISASFHSLSQLIPLQVNFFQIRLLFYVHIDSHCTLSLLQHLIGNKPQLMHTLQNTFLDFFSTFSNSFLISRHKCLNKVIQDWWFGYIQEIVIANSGFYFLAVQQMLLLYPVQYGIVRLLNHILSFALTIKCHKLAYGNMYLQGKLFVTISLPIHALRTQLQYYLKCVSCI